MNNSTDTIPWKHILSFLHRFMGSRQEKGRQQWQVSVDMEKKSLTASSKTECTWCNEAGTHFPPARVGSVHRGTTCHPSLKISKHPHKKVMQLDYSKKELKLKHHKQNRHKSFTAWVTTYTWTKKNKRINTEEKHEMS